MNNYIDVHCHALYGIDDGSRSIDESINIINNLYNIGFNDIILTPHYIDGTEYSCNNFGKKILISTLKDRLNNPNIHLYLGNEIFLFDKIMEYVKNDEIMSLNSTKYLLIEFPMEYQINNTDEYLFKLISYGYIPVIAHPERYGFIQKNPNEITKYINMGVLFQGNYASITGRYGHHAERTLKFLLKHHYISFLGSDTHHETSTFYKDFAKMKRRIIAIVGNEEFTKLAYTNPLKIINRLD
jgi:protein-tyrosine phosphatase